MSKFTFTRHWLVRSAAPLMALALLFGASTSHAAPAKAKRSSATEVTGVVNLNTASLKQLAMLPGIGPKTAEKIVAARPFQSTDQITKVKGIGLKRYRALKPHLVVSGESTIAVHKKRSTPKGKKSAQSGKGSKKNAHLASAPGQN